MIFSFLSKIFDFVQELKQINFINSMNDYNFESQIKISNFQVVISSKFGQIGYSPKWKFLLMFLCVWADECKENLWVNFTVK